MDSQVFEIKSYSKLNLSLNIFKKRSDGMHPISSVFQNIDLSDDITIRTTPKKGLEFSSNYSSLETDPSNLFFRIYNYFEQVLHQGFNITLSKHIPVGGGLGGGSGNAAAFIEFICNWGNLNLTHQELVSIGQSFGSDIPFFFTGGTALVTGIGDCVQPIHYPDTPPYFLLIIPDLHISTPELFKTYDSYYSEPPSPSHELGKNDFWEILKEKHEIYNKLSTFCSVTLNHNLCLSGTGATTFLAASSLSEAQNWERLILDNFSLKTIIAQPTSLGYTSTTPVQ